MGVFAWLGVGLEALFTDKDGFINDPALKGVCFLSDKIFSFDTDLVSAGVSKDINDLSAICTGAGVSNEISDLATDFK